MTPWSWWTVRKYGAHVAWWTVDSGDTWQTLPDPQMIEQSVLRDRGGVVLLHDFDRESMDASQRAAYVLDVTERLICLARRKGWPLLTMRQLLQHQ